MLIVKREISIGVELWAVFTAVGAASTLAEIAISGLRRPSSSKLVRCWDLADKPAARIDVHYRG
jgi:hypothetical protein